MRGEHGDLDILLTTSTSLAAYTSGHSHLSGKVWYLAMLPPVDPAIRADNPQFDTLYRDLCERKLNPNGTTRLDAKALKAQQAFAQVSSCIVTGWL